MNVLAATIAAYGLLANSPAVVIGAMIVAMLLGPIMGTSLALVDGDILLLRKGVFSLIVGIAGVMVMALILGLIHKNVPLTDEIMSRTAPNLLDLMVALAGGAAGAYATVSPRLSVAFIGVAIATALVPPLVAASLLLARSELELAFGALLLALTNMVAIQFASSVVLWISGFRNVTQTSGLALPTLLRRNIVSLAVLLVLGISLTANLQQVISRQLFESAARSILQQEIEALPGSYLAEVWYETAENTTIIHAVMRGPLPPTTAQVAAMEAELPPSPDSNPLELRIRYVLTIVLNRDGQMFTDLTESLESSE
jgi:uncharacterized hydrophobic protein (TIGR00271 family)